MLCIIIFTRESVKDGKLDTFFESSKFFLYFLFIFNHLCQLLLIY